MISQGSLEGSNKIRGFVDESGDADCVKKNVR